MFEHLSRTQNSVRERCSFMNQYLTYYHTMYRIVCGGHSKSQKMMKIYVRSWGSDAHSRAFFINLCHTVTEISKNSIIISASVFKLLHN